MLSSENTISSSSSLENVIPKLQNHTVSLFEHQGTQEKQVLLLASSLWGKLSQTMVCNLSLENAFPGLYNVNIFWGLKLLSRSGIYKSPPSNLGSGKYSMHHWYYWSCWPVKKKEVKIKPYPAIQKSTSVSKAAFDISLNMLIHSGNLICYSSEASVVNGLIKSSDFHTVHIRHLIELTQ